MKTILRSLPLIPALVAATLTCAATHATAQHSVNEMLVEPAKWEGKSVRLDIAGVVPVRWKSRVEGVQFFHALSIDSRDKKHGGAILVAVAEPDVKAFVNHFGLGRERGNSNILRGTLKVGYHPLPALKRLRERAQAADEKAPEASRKLRRGGVYYIDYLSHAEPLMPKDDAGDTKLPEGAGEPAPAP